MTTEPAEPIDTTGPATEPDAAVKRGRGRPPLTEEQKAGRNETAERKVQTFPPDHEFEFHDACLLFDEITDEDFADMVEDIRQHGLLTPITQLPDGRVIDGKNRVRACRQAGVKIRARTYTGTNPVAFAISVNDRRRHSTKTRRREVIAPLLQENPGLSDRMIGRTAGASKNTVAAERARQEAGGQIDHQETRMDKRGRRQPARKRPTAPVKPAPEATPPPSHVPSTAPSEWATAERKTQAKPPSGEPAPSLPEVQKWARYLANQMSVNALRELRDAINEILAAANQSGSAAVH